MTLHITSCYRDRLGLSSDECLELALKIDRSNAIMIEDRTISDRDVLTRLSIDENETIVAALREMADG